MITNKLPIQQASDGEVYGDKVVFNSTKFKTELHKYGVNDLFDEKLTIKQDKEKYIFAVSGENKFAVDTKINFISFINDFYKDLAKTEKRAAEKKAVIDVSEFEKKTQVEITYTETVKDLDELESQIKKNDKLSENATDIENVKDKVERLITFYEQEKDLTESETAGSIFNTKYDRKDKGLRKIHKTEINRRIKELNKIKEQIEWLANNKNKKYTINRDIDTKDNTKKEVKNVEMDDINGMDMKMTLKQFSDRIEDLGKEAPDFILARNDILLEKADTVPYYEIIVYDKSDAKKLKNALKKINKEYVKLNKKELTAAKRQEVSKDLEALEEYLNKVIDNPDTFKPSEHPFVPTHAKEFYELVKLDPTLAAFVKLNKDADKKGKSNTTIAEAGTNETDTSKDQENKWNEYTTSIYGSAKEAFEKWGINGLKNYGLNQTNMNQNKNNSDQELVISLLLLERFS